MRILVADQNALLLAAIAGTFGRHCAMVTATTREACLEHLAQERFDVVVACEKLRDYTGLELLSEIETIAPQTLRIFSAPPAQLARLGSRLDQFGLLGTLSYPIDARKLLLALKVARTRMPAKPAPPKVRHVVLESEWDTGERLGILERKLEVEPAEPPTLAAAAAPVPTPSPAAAPDDVPIFDAVEETAVSHVRWAHGASAVEVSFEISFDEKPNRVEATAVQPRVVEPAPPASGGHPVFVGEPSPPESVNPAFQLLRGNLGPPANDPSVEPPPPPPPPPVDTGGAANEPKFDPAGAKGPAKAGSGTTSSDLPGAGKSSSDRLGADNASASRSSSDKPRADGSAPDTAGSKTPAAAGKTQPSSTGKKAAANVPGPRRQAVPTAAQREAFQRAVARRKSGRTGASGYADTNTGSGVQTGGIFSAASASGEPSAQPPRWRGAQSLSDLARMATNKRPLPQAGGKLAPNRKLLMAGSGVAAVLLASVLAFQLTRSHAPTHHGRQAVAAQIFTPDSNVVAQNNAADSAPQVFGPPPGQTEQTASVSPTPNLPQPQVFDPNTAPADPPPPPAFEHPGPIEPPSISSYQPPPGAD